MGKLTVLQVNNKKDPGRLPDGGGLFFEVTSSGIKRWLYRYKIFGKQGLYVIGRYPESGKNKGGEFKYSKNMAHIFYGQKILPFKKLLQKIYLKNKPLHCNGIHSIYKLIHRNTKRLSKFNKRRSSRPSITFFHPSKRRLFYTSLQR